MDPNKDPSYHHLDYSVPPACNHCAGMEFVIQSGITIGHHWLAKSRKRDTRCRNDEWMQARFQQHWFSKCFGKYGRAGSKFSNLLPRTGTYSTVIQFVTKWIVDWLHHFSKWNVQRFILVLYDLYCCRGSNAKRRIVYIHTPGSEQEPSKRLQ